MQLLPRGAVPPDVFKLVGSLRNDPSLKQNFTQVELGNIGQSAAVGKGPVTARFSIMCQGAK